MSLILLTTLQIEAVPSYCQADGVYELPLYTVLLLSVKLILVYRVVDENIAMLRYPRHQLGFPGSQSEGVFCSCAQSDIF